MIVGKDTKIKGGWRDLKGILKRNSSVRRNLNSFQGTKITNKWDPLKNHRELESYGKNEDGHGPFQFQMGGGGSIDFLD